VVGGGSAVLDPCNQPRSPLNDLRGEEAKAIELEVSTRAKEKRHRVPAHTKIDSGLSIDQHDRVHLTAICYCPAQYSGEASRYTA
jgi:hypothetical protein